jgi:hypothetical protein
MMIGLVLNVIANRPLRGSHFTFIRRNQARPNEAQGEQSSWIRKHRRESSTRNLQEAMSSA